MYQNLSLPTPRKIVDLLYGGTLISGLNVFVGTVVGWPELVLGSVMSLLVLLLVLALAAFDFNHRTDSSSYRYLFEPVGVALLTSGVGLLLVGLQLQLF